MANYKYRCSDCGNFFNVEATIQEKEESVSEKFTCPQCHSLNTKSEFSTGNFIKNIFKGENKTDSCCSAKNNEKSSDCKSNTNKKNDCCNGNNNGGCCG